jgi:hypothetical protein
MQTAVKIFRRWEFPFVIEGKARAYGWALCAYHHAATLEIQTVEGLGSTLETERMEWKEIGTQKKLLMKEVVSRNE